jgi:hypothetical protein
MYTGPHIIKDGLVFGYDTGYGIADNDNATRFYPGEKTTNLADTDAKRNFGAHGGNSCTTSSAPEYGPGWKKLTVTNIAGNNSRVAQLPYLTQPSGGTRTYSIEYDVTGLTGYKLKVDGTGGYSIVSIQGKGRHSATISSVSQNSSLALFLIKSGTHTNINEVVYYRYYQVEVNSHATPFVDGTRSSTASLIDLKETTDIDVSNVSFDSTGQPNFDGTDDKGVVTNFPHIWDSSLSVESVVSWDDDTRSVIFGNYNQGTGGHDINFEKNPGGVLRFYWDRGSRDVYTTGNPVVTTSGAYHHVVFIRDAPANNFKFYVDGELVTTVSNAGSGISSTGSTFRFGADTRNGATVHNGSIPVIKAYNKALTATEIKQNFNAYKNRFSI